MPPFGGSPPAMPGQVQQPGKDMKGRLQMGLILALLEMAMPNITDPEDKTVAEGPAAADPATIGSHGRAAATGRAWPRGRIGGQSWRSSVRRSSRSGH